MNIESVIFSNLLFNEEYGRKVSPFLKDEYFSDSVDRNVFKLIDSYLKKYNAFPSKEALLIELKNLDNISQDTYEKSNKIIDALDVDSKTDLSWLLDKTEKFCQEKAIYNAIMGSIQILDDKTGNMSKGSIPKILSDALAVSFDTSIGHDFLEDFDSRFEFYHTKEVRIPFDLNYLNKITQGGLPRKTLNIALAGTGVGKSLFMCHCASANLVAGLNVLYITMEMSEEKIAERIDANLLDVTLDELRETPKELYDRKVARVKEKTKGKLIIKEYPTACAGSANFRHLLNELKIKKSFVPDVIYIDYLNICMSSRLKAGANVNSYTYVKAIAEELRGLAVEFDVPVISATQTTRSGYSNTDVGLEDTSESFGLPATADLMFALVSDETMAEENKLLIKQLKNRYGDPNYLKKFFVGINRSKMRLYDIDDPNVDDAPVMDNTTFGRQDNDRMSSKFDMSKFEGFK